MRNRVLVIALVASSVAAPACAPGPTKGTVPPGPGLVDPSTVPDFIAVAGREDGIVGYVPKAYLFGESAGNAAQVEPYPVYAADLTTLIGHLFPDRGFVPLGVDPATVPEAPHQERPSFGPATP